VNRLPEECGENLRIVTIDGPAGCGKSTVVRGLVNRFRESGVLAVGFSTGQVYRGLTWLVLERGIDPGDVVAVRSLAAEVQVQVVPREGELRLEFDGKDPGVELYSDRVTESIHWVSDDGDVRAAMLPLQRSLSLEGGVILAEGRDLGTVVYPDAEVKVFLTARLEERARRRHVEFRDRLGEEISLESVIEKVARRDDHDANRQVSPLRPADDAIVIDTTDRTPEQVVAKIFDQIPVSWFPA